MITTLPLSCLDAFNFDDGDVLFTAQMARDYYCATHGMALDDLAVQPLVIGCFLPEVWRQMIVETTATPATHWLQGGSPRLYHGHVGGQALSLMLMPAGAPLAAATLEEVIACGGRAFLFVGSAGSLQSHVPVGSLVVVQNAVRHEGTSYHYLPAQAPAVADERWVETLLATGREIDISIFAGTTWTTDAPYRELKTTASDLRARGVLTVEMEAAAILAVAQARNVSVGILLVISDEHSADWRPAPGSAAFAAGVESAVQIALRAARSYVHKDFGSSGDLG
ncbi:MAG: nucleoside phosphorylase [Anaerolineae bacterium]|nr:nucleoside phosphorylase [Anaerolineae bacterium]